MTEQESAERHRLRDADRPGSRWRRWGPYLSERQWGTVREDYSANGDAWSFVTHDQARSRAYRWGEDGIAGVSDDEQQLCFSVALWNGRDPILKERLFGLTNAEGNHGEDVKEYYFYLDSTPTHSYLRYLYKYPQAAFPYTELVATNRSRGRGEFEYELLDTGVFDDNRYYDVDVEYAKADEEDLLVRITVHNRGPEAATLHVLPTLLFRNTWSWAPGKERPHLVEVPGPPGTARVTADHPKLGRRTLSCDGTVPLLFTENESNTERLFGTPNSSPFVKDGVDQHVVRGRPLAVNPEQRGTKVAAHYVLDVPAGGSASIRLRLSEPAPGEPDGPFGPEFDALVDARRAECEAFYEDLCPPDTTPEERRVIRQALAGLLWNKQYYHFDVETWLTEHGYDPIALDAPIRNRDWPHLLSGHLISMPDKWEYPWFAAWDLAFHAVALALVDVGFAKQQLDLLLRRFHLHPNGQIPAYEWNFSDVNPPVHAWATLFVYQVEKGRTGNADRAWLENAFHKLSKNFTWWVNRKDADGNNIFQGGFLGLDNIGVFDRSAPLPTGGHLDQADGTAWMALFAQSMLSIALELGRENPVYLEEANMYFEHFAWIAAAMNRVGADRATMWDEDDGFFYDLLRRPDGTSERLSVRSMVGLLPMTAATVLPSDLRTEFPELVERAQEFLARHPEIMASITPSHTAGLEDRVLLALLDEKRLRRVLARMLDEGEFLSRYGLRSLSKYHAQHPYHVDVNGQDYGVGYLPAESDSGMFGGNSNWRGPIWFPVNALVIRALINLYTFYGDDFTVECPTGSGRQMTLYEVAEEISDRLTSIFLPDEDGNRPVFGGQHRFADDPHWRDLLLFYEYFHGDNGAGLGASHQTGWTGLVAVLAGLFKNLEPAELCAEGTSAAFRAFRFRTAAP
ncbi:MGH1-like glycoside hydrolase domain-containing protein [Cryptosporangium aurantiacum]|uniref:Glycosyl hydrolase family 63 C-terminal domain-containing protein n=1 Tax=Cryptosporangium aurantiacum TaxID=134849 RepID=A0A1M7RG53_9ACTN|nr:glucosidase [Cryptosporangium aurantiacum]SHN45119.1 Glycosyl hydrolase family 63 C-terminal domain-containing protein [Cryptosporangium aurantiacum]